MDAYTRTDQSMLVAKMPLALRLYFLFQKFKYIRQ